MFISRHLPAEAIAVIFGVEFYGKQSDLTGIICFDWIAFCGVWTRVVVVIL